MLEGARGYKRQHALNMVIPDWEVTCRETLSLAEMKRTVPRVRVMSERVEVAVASPRTTNRMPAQSTGATVYCFIEAGTCGERRRRRGALCK